MWTRVLDDAGQGRSGLRRRCQNRSIVGADEGSTVVATVSGASGADQRVHDGAGAAVIARVQESRLRERPQSVEGSYRRREGAGRGRAPVTVDASQQHPSITKRFRVVATATSPSGSGRHSTGATPVSAARPLGQVASLELPHVFLKTANALTTSNVIQQSLDVDKCVQVRTQDEWLAAIGMYPKPADFGVSRRPPPADAGQCPGPPCPSPRGAERGPGWQR